MCLSDLTDCRRRDVGLTRSAGSSIWTAGRASPKGRHHHQRPTQLHRRPAGRGEKHGRNAAIVADRAPAAVGRRGLFIHLFIYLFISPASVMAGVHGCGCWGAGATSSSEAFRSSAWAGKGPNPRLDHSVGGGQRLGRGWGPEPAKTTTDKSSVKIGVFYPIWPFYSSRLSAHSSTRNRRICRPWNKRFLQPVGGKTVIKYPLFPTLSADWGRNTVTVQPYRPEHFFGLYSLVWINRVLLPRWWR